jgi:hypothetical protein
MQIVCIAVLIGLVVQFTGRLKVDLTPMLALLVATTAVLSRSM